MTTLLDAVRRRVSAYPAGVNFIETPIPGVGIVQASAPSGLDHAISKPLLCLVVQGSKQVSFGKQAFAFAAGEPLLITADVPTISQITGASALKPYYSLVLELDLAIIADLAVEISSAREGEAAPVRVDPTDAEVSDAALRLLQLLERPEAVRVLQKQMLRELHYWLLVGRHGSAIRKLFWPDSHAQRLARAIKVLRAEFDRPLPVERLAALAGMSPSAFHQHFRAMTSLSPLQFQKRLRLIEARRLMLSEGVSAAQAAFAVGYESVPQFTREYGRMFGLPPARDRDAARGAA
jgi:AraC-like DNA-binding protein